MDDIATKGIKLKLLGNPKVYLGTWQELKLELPLFLCVYLALQDAWVSREAILALFWPDEEEANAKLRLRQLLFRTRKLAWVDLESHHEQVRLTVATDVGLFKQALAAADWRLALTLYEADLLDNLGSAPPQFQVWLEHKREDLRRLWHTAVLNHCWNLALNKEHKEACIWLEQALRRDPLDEDALQLLLFHLAALANRTQALRYYHQFKDRLQQEFGVEPGFISQEIARLLSSQRVISQADLLSLYLQEDRHWPLSLHLTKPKGGKTPLQGLSVQTRFFGRERDLAELSFSLQLPERRLITLMGVGGVGKTRLAQELLARVGDLYKDGVVFAELISLPSSELLAERLAELLKLELSADMTARDALVAFLDGKDILLVLDNFEHILAASTLLVDLLACLPKLRILVTSRESLGVREEWRYPLKGLAVPQNLDNQESFAAVELFLDRAQRIKLDFRPDALEKRAVVRICQLLSGLPLAIELVVTWLPVLVPQEIVLELEQTLDLISSHDPALPERHTSMWAVLETSWQLLGIEEQGALKRLAIFKGDFQREAAINIADLNLRLLLSLINKSLLQQHANGRFDLPVPVQQYARAKLSDEEFTSLKQRFVRYYVNLAEISDEALRTPKQTEVLSRMAQEIDNFRQVFAYALIDDPDSSSRLAVALSLFWGIQGHLYDVEGWRTIQTILAQPRQTTSDLLKAKLFRAAGARVRMTREFHLAEDYLLTSLTLMRRLEDQDLVALGRSFNELSIYFGIAEKPDQAESYYLELLALAEKTQNLTLNKLIYGNLASHYVARYERLRIPYNKAKVTELLTIARSFELSQLARAMDARTQGLIYLHDAAVDLAQQTLLTSQEAHKSLGDNELVEFINFYLGHVAYKQGNYPQAFKLMEQGLELLRRGQKVHFLINQLNRLAQAYLEQAEQEAARPFLQEAIHTQKELGFRLPYSRLFSLENLMLVAWYEGDAEQMLLMAGVYEQEIAALPLRPEPQMFLETLLSDVKAKHPLAKKLIAQGAQWAVVDLLARA